MKLIGALAATMVAASFCCCGDLVERGVALFSPDEPEVPPVVVEEVVALPPPALEIEIPARARELEPKAGELLVYTAPFGVDRARQFHDQWLREGGWMVQVDTAKPTGWLLEGFKTDTRLSFDILDKGDAGVVVVIKRL